MANPLLARAAPELLARRGQAIDIVEHVSTFARLAEIVAGDHASLEAAQVPPRWRERPVTVELAFAWADVAERVPRVEGRASTTVPMTCQRCLECCEISLVADIALLLLPAGEGRAAGEALEVWELEEETLRPLELVEEALVMALPFAAKHADTAECAALAAVPAEERTDTVRPFAGLKDKLDRSR